MTESSKECIKCERPLSISSFYRDKGRKDGRVGACKTCKSEYNKKYYSITANKRRMQFTMKKYYAEHQNERLLRSKDEWLALRSDVIKGYGGLCRCCGETELVFLSIDHINDDGAIDRKERTATRLYRQLSKEGYPDGFQVLCRNCNWAKFRGGCPHQKEDHDVALT